ncbi:conserved exported hypothetical protein [uncultured Eubacteriales bacterium]|uniref:SLH domain-containing protein n=1 Tax=uncultured Eubacteriales bacterium TaxID=172733 RepID=A0A212J1Q6_9FIRM|nr:conserved exported hypothetical protein [uncultured Eubacteriales bacterium]
MRNLKRVLSLALASVMLLGMMVIGAGAADTTYSDQSTITKDEAVAVMSAVGVFQGSDGKFSPTGDLTRESAAKIITYMVMGKSAADDLKASSAPFTDVAADRWSAGSIAYCVANGIISGDGLGHFYPETTVTGIQFGKMLLVALGYNATTEGYVGSGYEVNIAKQINSLKLASGVDVGMSSVLNREQAAQMALNAIQKSLVEYVGGTNISLPDGTTVISGGTRQNVKDGDGKVITFMGNYMSKLKRSTGGDEAFGRPAHQWKYGATSIGVYGDSAFMTYTAKTKESVIKSDLSGYTTAKVEVSTDGATVSDVVLDNAKIAALTGNGTSVEIYTAQTSEGDYYVSHIVVVHTQLALITNVNTASKTVSLSIKSAGGGNKVVKNEDNADLYTALAAIGKDNYAIITVADGVVETAAKAEIVSGNLEKVTKDGDYVIAGDTYSPGAKSSLGDTDTGNSYDFYLDTLGYVLYATEETTGSTTQYAYLLNTSKEGSASSGWTYLAKLLYTDGTQEWVDLASVDTIGVKSSSFDDTFTDLNAMKNKAFVSYSVKSDGTYALTTFDSTGNTLTASTTPYTADVKAYSVPSSSVVTKGDIYFLTNTAGDVTYDVKGLSSTIFLVHNESTNTYKAYTGYKNISSFSGVSGTVLMAKNSNSASIVVLTGDSTAKDLVYILSDKASKGYDTDLSMSIYTYDAIVDGKIGSITTTIKVDTTSTALGLGLYTINKYNDDYAAELTAVPTADKETYYRAATSLEVDSGLAIVDAGTYGLATGCTIIGIDEDGDALEGLTASDVAYYTDADAGNSIIDVTLFLDSEGEVTSIVFQWVTAD